MFGLVLDFMMILWNMDASATALLIARVQAVVFHDQLHAVAECSDHL